MPFHTLGPGTSVEWGANSDDLLYLSAGSEAGSRMDTIALDREDARELVERLLEFLEQTGPRPRSSPAKLECK